MSYEFKIITHKSYLILTFSFAHVAQLVEHPLGKGKADSSNLSMGSRILFEIQYLEFIILKNSDL